MKPPFENTTILLFLIGIIAILLSIAAYQFSNIILSEINKIISEDLKSNAQIEVHDLSNAISNKIISILQILQLVSQTIAEENDATAQLLLYNAQNATSDITDGYYIVNSKGVIIAQSGQNQSSTPVRMDNTGLGDYFTIS